MGFLWPPTPLGVGGLGSRDGGQRGGGTGPFDSSSAPQGAPREEAGRYTLTVVPADKMTSAGILTPSLPSSASKYSPAE